jgi:MFS family permease
LPIFLLGLPAGAAADMVDRRRWLIFTQSLMLAVAAVLGVMVLIGVMSPWWLLALTFGLGVGSAMNAPAWSATIPELVPREELAAAVALNSVGFNIARAIGPALGGAVMAASNAGIVFLLNAVSFLAVILVLWRWKEPPAVAASTDPLHLAMREGLRYVRATPTYHAVLVRVGLFSFAGSALWALLPVVASAELSSTSTDYGILLGCLGAGSVIGAAMLAPLRRRFSADRAIAVGVVMFGAATAALALLKSFGLLSFAMVAGGVAWMTVMSTFNVCAQIAPPPGIRARALAVYILVFQGALAIGSGAWGVIAGRVGVRSSLIIAAAMIAAGIVTEALLPLSPRIVKAPEYAS